MGEVRSGVGGFPRGRGCSRAGWLVTVPKKGRRVSCKQWLTANG